jgi:hypothetical protein
LKPSPQLDAHALRDFICRFDSANIPYAHQSFWLAQIKLIAIELRLSATLLVFFSAAARTGIISADAGFFSSVCFHFCRHQSWIMAAHFSRRFAVKRSARRRLPFTLKFFSPGIIHRVFI